MFDDTCSSCYFWSSCCCYFCFVSIGSAVVVDIAIFDTLVVVAVSAGVFASIASCVVARVGITAPAYRVGVSSNIRM